MRSKSKNQNKLMRLVTLPIRALGKAKDLYVRSIMDCAPKVSHGYPSGQLPKSYSSHSCRSNETDDFRELVKANSVRNINMDVKDMEAHIVYPQMRVRQSKGLPKSCSVGMGRIEEDSGCEYEDGAEEMAAYPRSRSYAVTNSRT